MNKYAYRILVVISTLVVVVVLAACSQGASKPTAITNDNNAINNDVNRLQQVEKLPKLNDSADLKIQSYLYTAEADPNKIWYLATIDMTGQVISYYTIRGPVVPASDQVTSANQQVCQGGSNGDKNCDTVGLAEPNGIYAGNTNDHLAITTSGAILRWEGWYQVSDQPFNLKSPVQLVLNENAAPSKTDLTTTEGGSIPSRGGK